MGRQSSAGVSAPLARPWMKWVLLAAGAYNLAWGLFSIAAPNALFEWAGMDPPRYAELWQCIGMIVGVYGIGYIAAAFDPLRHWPIVLVGFLGKIFGPIGFAGALLKGTLPPAFGATIITNDLIWWAPFAMILWAAFRQSTTTPDVADAGDAISELPVSGSGESLAELSHESPVFAVLLRHAGCTFHREALDDLRDANAAIEGLGARLAIVHMGEGANEIESAAVRYDLSGVPHVSDPDRRLYQQLGLPRGGFADLFGAEVFRRGCSACVLNGHGVGALKGDGFQLGGLALVQDGRVAWSRSLRSAAERPDYARECREALEGAENPAPAVA
ncbi:MAG: AhpC/TSA family protein [Planctomycetota bacterium]